MKSNIYDIKTPELKNNKWLVFENSVFTDLDTLDCDDTVQGKCYEDKTFDECLDVCNKSNGLCSFGYYIYRKNNTNLCVPIQKLSKTINMVYRLRNKTIYPELNDVTVKTFLNKNVFQFPPADANTIFYMDNFLFENVETNTIVNNTIISDIQKKTISKLNTNTNDVVFSNDGNLQIHMLEIPISLSVGIQYVPVKYGDKVAFNIPTTNLVMRPSVSENTLEWISRSFNLSTSTSFTLIPLPDSDKKIGDYVSYSDTFSIHSNVFILGVNEWYNIELYYYKNYKEAKLRNKNVTFRFKPKEQGWYCNKEKPLPISFDKMIVDKNNIGSFNGMKISRYPNVFGTCKYTQSNNSYKSYKSNHSYNSLFFLIFLFIMYIFYLKILKKFKIV